MQVLSPDLVILLPWVKLCLRSRPFRCWMPGTPAELQRGSAGCKKAPDLHKNWRWLAGHVVEKVPGYGNKLQGDHLWGADPEHIYKLVFCRTLHHTELLPSGRIPADLALQQGCRNAMAFYSKPCLILRFWIKSHLLFHHRNRAFVCVRVEAAQLCDSRGGTLSALRLGFNRQERGSQFCKNS